MLNETITLNQSSPLKEYANLSAPLLYTITSIFDSLDQTTDFGKFVFGDANRYI